MKGLDAVLLFCFCVADYYKLTDPKQHLPSHRRCGQEPGHRVAGASAQGLTGLPSSCWLDCTFL